TFGCCSLIGSMLARPIRFTRARLQQNLVALGRSELDFTLGELGVGEFARGSSALLCKIRDMRDGGMVGAAVLQTTCLVQRLAGELQLCRRLRGHLRIG